MKIMFTNIKKLLLRYWSMNKRFLKIVLIACIAAFLLALAIAMLFGKKEQQRTEIIIEDTPIEISSIMPKGDIVVCSSLIEDYATLTKTEKHLGLIPEEHVCVQILKMKCSFKLDLSKVQYSLLDSSNVVLVKLPELEYVQSLQDSPFKSDDEAYWATELPNTNKLKDTVAKKIRAKFDTPTNRRKGKRYAEDAISEILRKLGYEAQFEHTITRERH